GFDGSSPSTAASRNVSTPPATSIKVDKDITGTKDNHSQSQPSKSISSLVSHATKKGSQSQTRHRPPTASKVTLEPLEIEDGAEEIEQANLLDSEQTSEDEDEVPPEELVVRWLAL